MKLKNTIVQLLGVLTTLISIALIYLILFKDGKIRAVSAAMLIEFAIVIFIAVSTKFFWYTSTENAVRTSEPYQERRRIVTEAIESNITDAKEFDDFVEVENDNNYNTYVSNHCKNMTVANYRMSIFDCVNWLFKRKPKQYYMIRYMLKIERRAAKQHKLSGSNIRSLTHNNNGLTDDRNKAALKKLTFLWTGSVFSFVFMLFTAAIAFENKADIDMHYAILKMTMYVSQILFSILQSILKAKMTVETEDLAYFNKILSILGKYEAYKASHYTVEKVSYIPKEVIDGANNEQEKTR